MKGMATTNSHIGGFIAIPDPWHLRPTLKHLETYLLHVKILNIKIPNSSL